MDQNTVYKKFDRVRSLGIVWMVTCALMLISVSVAAEIQTETADTPIRLLETAIKEGQLDHVRALIEAGTDVNEPLNQGITPLHAAVISNQENIAAVLLQAGAKVNATDPTTEATPLHLAALYGREGIAKLLIQKGARVNAVMKFGITPLLVAAQFGQSQIIQLLLDKKANINQMDQEGFTALHFAAKNGNALVARLLVDQGAKLDIADKTHQATALEIAIENNHPEVVQLLKEKGAAQ